MQKKMSKKEYSDSLSVIAAKWEKEGKIKKCDTGIARDLPRAQLNKMKARKQRLSEMVDSLR